MKKLVLASILAVSGTARAFAADPAITEPIIDLAQPVYDWSGFYVGAQVGYGWADIDRVNTGGFANSFDADGFLGGIHVGGNFQSGAFVFGAEGDIEFSDIEGNDNGVGGSLDSIDIDWMGSLRARVGYAWDRVLIYGTAGIAFADVNANNSGLVNDSNTHIGWTVGAGAEFAFSENWTTRLEYRFTDLGDDTYTLLPAAFNANYDLHIHAVRVGISYKF